MQNTYLQLVEVGAVTYAMLREFPNCRQVVTRRQRCLLGQIMNKLKFICIMRQLSQGGFWQFKSAVVLVLNC